MSTFTVLVKRIRAIEPHSNADAIEFAVIEGYRAIVKKGEFLPGALVAYIPEAALLPAWLLKRMGFWDEQKGCGTLNGTDGNRVKAIKLRGQVSQGLCYPVTPTTLEDSPHTGEAEAGFVLQVDSAAVGVTGFVVREGDDVALMLGITKYEPPVPIHLAGEVFNAGQRLTIGFDIENWKSYPDVLQEGEEVVFTEKLHGTFTGIAVLPLKDAHPEAFGKDKNILIFSKGLGAQGLVFKNNERNAENLYVRATRALVAAIEADGWRNDEPIILMGETFGPGVQENFSYGKELGLRLFAAAIGYRGSQQYQDFSWLNEVSTEMGVPMVPVLYQGPFSEEKMREYTDGATTLDAAHIREGIVMTPITERVNPIIGRVCLKSVSVAYLTRKGGTEFS